MKQASSSLLTHWLLSLCLLASLGSVARAQTIELYAELDADQTFASSPAVGFASITVDTSINRLDYHLEFSGLLSAQVSAHFHGPANPGQSGGILHSIGVGNPKIGVWNYDEADEADIIAGRIYINVHTSGIPFGEIRGQVCPRPIEGCQCDGAAAPCGNPDVDSGCANSTGQGAEASISGLPSVILDSLAIEMSDLPASQFGIFFAGMNEVSLPFGDGLRCVGGSLFRFPVINTGAAGTVTLGPGIAAYTAANFPALGVVDAGEVWGYQFWYRDPTGPCGSFFNTSESVRVTWTP